MALWQRPWRPALAVLAGIVGVLIARHQQHVHLVWGDPGTYTQLLIHRCGRVLALSVGWALIEAMLLVAFWLRPVHREEAHAL